MGTPSRDALLEDVRIIFRNFAGAEKQFNREGDRNFAVLLEEDVAQQMLEDGWNVKYTKPREDDEDYQPQAYLSVKIGTKGRPPRVVMVTSRGKTVLDIEDLAILDYAVIEKADLMLNPYAWSVNGREGVTAYLASLYVTIEESELDIKYGDVPEIGESLNYSE